MARRKIIHIDEALCDGCGLCASACAEGAIEVVAGKARLVSETYCDGLGACLGECPRGAITIEEREAAGFDEAEARRHLEGKKSQAVPDLPCGCPGSLSRSLSPSACVSPDKGDTAAVLASRLGNWPVQIALAPPKAPYFSGADLLIAADCVPFAFADFHRFLLAGKTLLVGCPKLDDAAFYQEKLTALFRDNGIRSVTVAHMEVPCCGGLVRLVKGALAASGRDIPLALTRIGIRGELQNTG